MKHKPLSPVKAITIILAAIAAGWGLPSLALIRSYRSLLVGESTAVTVSLTSPTSGSVVSNTIVLSATATSTAAPISRVEFYCDGKLIGIANSNNVPIPIPPTTLRMTQP